ncbi:MAG TPA: NADH-quinone oxidoreductase subunit L [Pyrinomonadaceae bacterium]|jgi:NADH-quinone oxidoreductase subunit L|nr:NADH-quinone oxidoreductase subunit L [Pyrinomonadaceae bacterium]
MTNHLLSVIVFAPLAGALINWLVGRRVRSETFVGVVACGAVGVSALAAFVIAFTGWGGAALTGDAATPVMSHLWTWIQVGAFRADFGFAMDRLSGIYACFITFVGLLIHVFATGYMHGDRGFYRFFAYLNLFMFMMLTLVLADNLLLMFVGWEGVGLCSYLLIGYYTDRREAGDAAKKAFVVNRIGDWGVVLGIMLVFFLTSHAGVPSISFFDKTAAMVGGGAGVRSALATIGSMPIEAFGWKMIFAGGVTSAAVLLFIGACGKSAQIPLYVWLPDAMAGPTPVSALIHAATMVTAGVYMVVRCSAIFTHAPTALFIVAIIGAATAIFAATIGIAQNDIKKVLAYSTVSQLGYMFLACGVGAFVAAIFHVMTHAFFKALLFLGSGSVIHGMHHEQDMRRMGGLKKYMPVTFAAMTAGWLAISGFPLLSGFFSKDEILWKTWSTESLGTAGIGKFLWLVGIVTAAITAIYMTRLMVMTFWGDERFRQAHAGGEADEAHAHAFDTGEKQHDAQLASAGDRPHHAPGENVDAHGQDATGGAHVLEDDEGEEEHHGPVEPHESPWTMTVPLVVLAVLSVVGGWVGIPYALSGGAVTNYFERTLDSVVARAPEVGSADARGEGAVERRAGANAQTPAPRGNEGALPQSVGEGEAGRVPAVEHTPDPSEISQERLFTLISVVVALVGIGIGWFLFRRRPLYEMPRLLENKYYVDEIYDAAIVEPIKTVSREGLWRFFDVGVIDGIVNGLGRGMREVGGLLRFLQPGFVRSYAAIILVGALAVIGYFAYSAVQLFNR